MTTAFRAGLLATALWTTIGASPARGEEKEADDLSFTAWNHLSVKLSKDKASVSGSAKLKPFSNVPLSGRVSGSADLGEFETQSLPSSADEGPVKRIELSGGFFFDPRRAEPDDDEWFATLCEALVGPTGACDAVPAGECTKLGLESDCDAAQYSVCKELGLSGGDCTRRHAQHAVRAELDLLQTAESLTQSSEDWQRVMLASMDVDNRVAAIDAAVDHACDVMKIARDKCTTDVIEKRTGEDLSAGSAMLTAAFVADACRGEADKCAAAVGNLAPSPATDEQLRQKIAAELAAVAALDERIGAAPERRALPDICDKLKIRGECTATAAFNRLTTLQARAARREELTQWTETNRQRRGNDINRIFGARSGPPILAVAGVEAAFVYEPVSGYRKTLLAEESTTHGFKALLGLSVSLFAAPRVMANRLNNKTGGHMEPWMLDAARKLVLVPQLRGGLIAAREPETRSAERCVALPGGKNAADREVTGKSCAKTSFWDDEALVSVGGWYTEAALSAWLPGWAPLSKDDKDILPGAELRVGLHAPGVTPAKFEVSQFYRGIELGGRVSFFLTPGADIAAARVGLGVEFSRLLTDDGDRKAGDWKAVPYVVFGALP